MRSYSDANQKFGHVDWTRSVSVELIENFLRFFIADIKSGVT